MTSRTSVFEDLLLRQSRRLAQRILLAFEPSTEHRGLLLSLLEAARNLSRVEVLSPGDSSDENHVVWKMEPEREQLWRQLISATQLRFAGKNPEFAQVSGIGEMKKTHLQTLKKSWIPAPVLARFLAKLLIFTPRKGGGWGEALRALGTYRGAPSLLECIDPSEYASFRSEIVQKLESNSTALDRILDEHDPLIVFAFFKPYDPRFCELLYRCSVKDRPLVAFQTESLQVYDRSTGFHSHRLTCLVVDSEVELKKAKEIGVPASSLVLKGDFAVNGIHSLRALGERHRMKRANKRRASISHAYAADQIVSRYCNLPKRHAIPASWVHFWISGACTVHPAQVAQHKIIGRPSGPHLQEVIERDKLQQAQWVARPDQAELLHASGYRNVEVVGLPFVYLPDVEVKREPGSLVVMPPHGYVASEAFRKQQAAYADYIAGIQDNFSKVVAVVAAGDHWQGIWSDAFCARDIPVIIGADPGEPDSLLWLKQILSASEFVTTNGYGSQIAYSAACGAKISISGPFAPPDEITLGRSHLVRTYPELLEIQRRNTSEKFLREKFPWLFVAPWEAQLRTEWGQAEIGVPYRLDPSALRALIRD